MSRELAAVFYLALCAASVALWLEQSIRRAFRDLRVDVVCPCGTCGGAR